MLIVANFAMFVELLSLDFLQYLIWKHCPFLTFQTFLNKQLYLQAEWNEVFTFQ